MTSFLAVPHRLVHAMHNNNYIMYAIICYRACWCNPQHAIFHLVLSTLVLSFQKCHCMINLSVKSSCNISLHKIFISSFSGDALH